MGKALVIAGTPGVGKSTIARLLSEKTGWMHIDLSSLALEKKHLSYYDTERETYVIDENALVETVSTILNEHEAVIIDTHYPEILPEEVVDIVIVLRLHPRILEERLRAKNWSWDKIRENVLAEILSVVTTNSIEKFGVEKVFEIDTTGKSVEEVFNTVYNILSDTSRYTPGLMIDWLEKIDPKELERYS